MKQNSTHRWFSLVRFGFIVALVGLLPTASHFAYAQTISTRIDIPGVQDITSSVNRLRTFTTGGVDLRIGDVLELNANNPSSTPGDNQPLPKFSGVNTPVILSENGPVNIADDAIAHGFIDIHGGIVNTDYIGRHDRLCADCDDNIDEIIQQPVIILDDVAINNGTEGGGELRVNGQIHSQTGISTNGYVSAQDSLTAGKVGSTSQITGSLNIVGGNVTITGTTRTLGNLTVGPAGTGNGVLTVNGEVQSTSARIKNITAESLNVGNDVSINGELSVQGRLTGSSFGKLYDAFGDVSPITSENWQKISEVSCNNKDILLSCDAYWGEIDNQIVPPSTNTVEWYAGHMPTGDYPSNDPKVFYRNKCTVFARKKLPANPDIAGKLTAQAMCFNPMGN